MTGMAGFDVGAFLDQPIAARIATAGPTVRPVFYLFEDEAFWIITGPSAALRGPLRRDPAVAIVVDVCDVHAGVIRLVGVRGVAEILPYDLSRARRLLARYMGPDETRWKSSAVQRYVRDAPGDTRYALLRVRPDSWTVRDLSHYLEGAMAPSREPLR